MPDGGEFSVKFWGVRGSIACPGPETARYGGNTSTLEVRCGDHLLIFDAGTGLRYLGNELARHGPLDTDIFLTHTHFDHILRCAVFCAAVRPRQQNPNLGRAPGTGKNNHQACVARHDDNPVISGAAGNFCRRRQL